MFITKCKLLKTKLSKMKTFRNCTLSISQDSLNHFRNEGN